MATGRDDDHRGTAGDPVRASGPAGASPRARRWPAVLVLVLGIVLAGVFGLRAWTQWQYTQRVARGEIRVETLRGWMTLPYVARVYGVPESELRAAIGAPSAGHDERSLRQWFEATGTDPLAGRRALEAAILARGGRDAGPTRP
jgi:hypothetical protein